MKLKIIVMTILALTFLVCLIQPALASPVWIEGKVTAQPYSDPFHRVQVAKKNYTLMKDAPIWERYQDRPGAYNERPASFKRVRKGDTILILAEDNRVYQLVIILK